MKALKFGIIALITMFFGFNLSAQTAIAPSMGNGTDADPYQIASLENLYWIAASDDVVPSPNQATRWSRHYIQTADIDASPTINWFDGQGWKSIGHYVGWNNPNNMPFTASYNGQSHLIISLFINQQYASPLEQNSGFIGYADGATIKNLCLSSVDISVISNTILRLGGLVGWGFSSTVTNCYVTGSVSGSSHDNNVQFIGGLVGEASSSFIMSTCYFEGEVSGNSRYGVRALIGKLSGLINNSYYNYESVLINGQYIVSLGALDSNLYNDWKNNNLMLEINDYLSYDGSNYLINDLNDLKRLLAFSYDSLSFRLTSDISLTSEPGFFIPFFSGNFDGNGFTISDLSVNIPDGYEIGLFGDVYRAIISNLGVTNMLVSGCDSVGGLVGRARSATINNCYSTGNVSGDGYIGGLVGVTFWGTSGWYTTVISNCYSTASVDAYFDDDMWIYPSSSLGGLVGRLSAGSLINCYSTGFINTFWNADYVGGLVGMLYSGTISDCYSTGFINNPDWYGNVIGGLVGGADGGDISNCYSTVSVSGYTEIGGLVGSSHGVSISNSYSTGNVSGFSYVGGLVASGSSLVSISNCYSTGHVSGGYLGGLVGGQGLPNIADSYWNTQTSGLGYSQGGEGRTTAQMTYPYADNTYVGWDFDNTWIADNESSLNGGYPFLRCFVEAGPFNIEANTPTVIGDITIITDTPLMLVPEIDSTTPAVIAIPNFANLSNIQVLGLHGSGTGNLTVAVGPGLWFGLIYFGGQWHLSEPPSVEGPGILSFTGIDFDAKGDVIIVLSDSEDPTLPVQLSAFDAVLTAQNYVHLNWVSESETDLLGYRVYRHENEVLADAMLISALIPGTNSSTQHSYEYVDQEIYESGTYYYWLESSDLDGSSGIYGPLSVNVEFQGEGPGVPGIDLVTGLQKVFPNPFNPSTFISYSLAEENPVSISIYNTRGQLVKNLSNCPGDIGLHQVYWDGRDSNGSYCSSGIYFIRMQAGRLNFQRKAILMK